MVSLNDLGSKESVLTRAPLLQTGKFDENAVGHSF